MKDGILGFGNQEVVTKLGMIILSGRNLDSVFNQNNCELDIYLSEGHFLI